MNSSRIIFALITYFITGKDNIFTCIIYLINCSHCRSYLSWSWTSWSDHERAIFNAPISNKPLMFFTHQEEFFKVKVPTVVCIVVSYCLAKPFWDILTLIWTLPNQHSQFLTFKKSVVVCVILKFSIANLSLALFIFCRY
jgi:hypothetical protein